MSNSLLTVAEAMYTGADERVDFDRERFGVTYGRTEDGYFVINTGNTVADAVASMFLNEVGIDNFANSIEALRGGEYGTAAKQALFGAAQAGLVLVPGLNVLRFGTRGALTAVRAAHRVGFGTAIRNRIATIPNNLRYMGQRWSQQPTMRAALKSLIPGRGSTARQLRAGRQQGIAPDANGVWRNLATGQKVKRPPVPQRRRPAARAARRNVREQMPITGKGAPPPWMQRANYIVGQSPGGGVAGTGFAASPLMAATGRASVVAAGGYGYTIRERMLENNALDGPSQFAEDPNLAAMDADRIRQQAADDEIRTALQNVDPEGPPAQALEELEADYNAAIGAINAQYNSAVNELRSMYQLSETEDEKERLRFLLADIEAQANAGRGAIRNVFERKSAEVGKLVEASRENSVKAAQRAFDLYSVSANQLKDELSTQRMMLEQQYAGLGATYQAPGSEYVNLLRAMAPIAQESRQAIGDINTAALEWMQSTMGEQQAARKADLHRLALSTRVAATVDHQRRVDDRINAERMALNQLTASLRSQQASAVSSIEAARLDQPEQQMWGPSDILTYLEGVAGQTMNVNAAIQEYQINFAGKPNPLGGVYPNSPTQDMLSAIRRGVVDARAAYEMEQMENRLVFAEMQEAQGGIAGGVPGAATRSPAEEAAIAGPRMPGR